VRRRDFITLLGAVAAEWSAVACPAIVRAQQDDRVRRVGVLMGFDESDPDAKSWLTGFMQELAGLGWTDGQRMRTDIRWAAGNMDRIREAAKELVGLQPDVVLSVSTPAAVTLQHETKTIPIVFAIVADPVGSGLVASLPRPGGNITGFGWMEASVAGKWLELLTQLAPAVRRAAIMFNPDTAPYVKSYFQPSFEAAARARNIELMLAPVRSEAEIEMVMTSLGREPIGGLVAMPGVFTDGHRAQIISLAARHHVPAVYGSAFSSVQAGGLLSYGPDNGDIFRRAAAYVDRILRGTKPADLPVQLPAQFHMTLNAKTAMALGLTVPDSILVLADEVIE
jgi:putative tryptophan/tyrosine transport system substrate-binding protein